MKSYLGVLLVVLAGCTSKEPHAEDRLRAHFPLFNLKLLHETSSSGLESQDFEGKDGERILRVRVLKNLDATRARALMRIDKAQLENLFQPARSPYTGAVSRATDCPGRPAPQFEWQEDRPAFRAKLAANERLQWGGCGANENVRLVQFNYVHCRQTLYQIKLFVKNETGANLSEALSFDCEAK